MISLPPGWEDVGPSSDAELHEFRKTYPDGLDVIVLLKRNGSAIEVWSSAVHRTSGPNDVLLDTVDTVEEALERGIEDMKTWDEDEG